jgi:hypothetical protein
MKLDQLKAFSEGREEAAAKALGISLRQLQKRLNGRVRTPKPRKPKRRRA